MLILRKVLPLIILLIVLVGCAKHPVRAYVLHSGSLKGCITIQDERGKFYDAFQKIETSEKLIVKLYVANPDGYIYKVATQEFSKGIQTSRKTHYISNEKNKIYTFYLPNKKENMFIISILNNDGELLQEQIPIIYKTLVSYGQYD